MVASSSYTVQERSDGQWEVIHRVTEYPTEIGGRDRWETEEEAEAAREEIES